MSTPAGLRVRVTPSAALVDELPAVVVSGCAPGRPVAVRAGMRDGLGRRWESRAEYEADGDGIV